MKAGGFSSKISKLRDKSEAFSGLLWFYGDESI